MLSILLNTILKNIFFNHLKNVTTILKGSQAIQKQVTNDSLLTLVILRVICFGLSKLLSGMQQNHLEQWRTRAKLLQSCPTLCNPIGCSLPGSSVQEVTQARILEWGVISSSRESSQPRDQICGSCDSFIGRWVFLPLAPAGKPRAIMVQGKVGHRGWSQRIWLWRPVGFDYRTFTGLGKQTLGGHKQNLVCTRNQEKGAVSSQESEPDLPVSVQESPAEVWVESGLLWGQGHWIQQCGQA